MPDISMCPGDECPLKEGCYRYRAKPDPMLQSYFVEAPFKGNECEYEIKVQKGDKLNEQQQKNKGAFK